MRALLRCAGAAVTVAAMVGLSGCSEPIEKLWQYRSYSASYSSPAVSNNLIVFGTSSGELHAVTRDGGFVWKFPTRKEIVSAPQILENLIFFGSTNQNLYAIDLKGRQVWKYTTLDRIKGDVQADPETNTVFVGSYDGHVYALDAVSRGERWVFPPVEQKPEDAPPPPEGETPPETPPAPVVDKSTWPQKEFAYARPTLTSNGLVVIGNRDGILYAIDKKTGELKWRWGVETAAKRTGGITSTVAERDGVLYFGSNDGVVHAIKLDDQSTVWEVETGGEVNSSPVIDSAGVLYVGSRDKKLRAIDAKTGAAKWEFEAEGPVLARPALYQGLVIFGGGEGDGHVYAVKTADGSLFWKHKTGDRVEADAYVDGDRFYIASGDKNLYAFKVNKAPGG